MIKCHDKYFELYIPRDELQQCVREVAEKISADFRDKSPILCPVLSGSYLFSADLTRNLTIDAPISFVRYTSYSGTQSTGKVKAELPFTESVADKDVIIVEDIVETGTAMKFMLEELSRFNPKSVSICTMFFKPNKFHQDFKVDYIGKSLPDAFILGYGLDYDGLGRFYPDLYVIKED